MNSALFSSKSEEWETPQDFFDSLDREFHFTLDACANKANAKCEKYFTKEENGLLKDWRGHTVFCNPPYGRKTTGEWVKKCYEEAQKQGTEVVALLPARTDTKFFHEYIYGKAEIRFVKGRLRFGGSKDGAPFPSMVVIFRKKKGDRRMNNDIISRAELEKELLKEYSQVLSDREKHPEGAGHHWQIEELDKVLKIVRNIPEIPDERIVVLPEGVKPGSRVYEIFRFMDEGGWEIDVHNFRLEDIPKWGKTVFGTREEAEKADEAAQERGIKSIEELL